MDPAMAREWEQSFENKSISELEMLGLPDGMQGHFIRRWQNARLAAIEARKAALNSARQTLLNQIGARAGQFSALPVESAAEAPPVEMPVPNEEQKRDFNSEDRAENLRQRIAAAVAWNSEPVPEQTLKAARMPAILESMLPLEAMTSQLSSSAVMVSGLVREFRENEFSVGVVCEIVKSMSVLIVANAALGKVVHQFQSADGGNGSEGRRSNAS